MKIRRKINRLLCRLFGHLIVEERYAVRDEEGKYRIIFSSYCQRCGMKKTETTVHRMSRSELLRKGWFIEK